jgi:hypothetical protein
MHGPGISEAVAWVAGVPEKELAEQEPAAGKLGSAQLGDGFGGGAAGRQGAEGGVGQGVMTHSEMGLRGRS